MERYSKCSKVNIMLRYFLFVVAFVCCGFVSKSMKINAAAPVISIPDEDNFDYEKGLTFYVGYEKYTVNSLKYDAGNGWVTISKPNKNYTKLYQNNAAENLCNKTSYITTCEDNIMEYIIPKDNLVINNEGKIIVTIEASNKIGFWGGKTTKEQTIVYDGKGPQLMGVTVTNGGESSSYAAIGEQLKFIVYLNEQSYIKWDSSKRTSISFMIGNKTKTATCAYSNNVAVESFSCFYYIKSGDSGNISSVSLVNGDNIEDKYGNKTAKDILIDSSLITNNVTIDGVKPHIKNVVAEEGTFSKDGTVQVEVTFSEKLFIGKGKTDSLKMKVRFGSNEEEKICVLESSENTDESTKLTYKCTVNGLDQGALHFIGLSGGDGWHDAAGNGLDLSKQNIEFSDTIADNSLPVIENIDVSTISCSSYNSDKYCVGGKTINVSIYLSMEIVFDQENEKNKISVLFGGKKGQGTYSISNIERYLLVSYVVSENDNGKLTVKYNGTLNGANGNSNKVDFEKAFSVYADNATPVIESVTLSHKGKETYLNEGNIIFGKPGDIINISANFNKNVTNFDFTQVFGVKADFDSSKDVAWQSSVVSEFSSFSISSGENRILITIVLSDVNKITNFKIYIGQSALTDLSNRTLESNYVSNVITINTLAPEYETNVLYPEYKGFNYNGEWVLISGNTIEFELESEHTDLDRYCIVEDKDSVCEDSDYKKLEAYNSELKSYGKYSYDFIDATKESNTFYIIIKDSAGNITKNSVSFKIKEMFEYSNGLNKPSKNHSIKVDLFAFAEGTLIKYKWIKKGEDVNFSEANTTSKVEDSFTIEGLNDYHGDYMVCIQDDLSNIVCSEYVDFDNKVDEFEVVVSSEWTNGEISTTLTFDDVSAINCIAIGKGVSSLGCGDNTDPDVTIYRTSEMSNPLTKYIIRENGVYYFYIEDFIGNSSLVSKTIELIDVEPIVIEVYNGNSEGYDSNLGTNQYKNNHRFLVTFDKDSNSGSAHSIYKYFFSENSYSINNMDVFGGYYINSFNKEEVTDCNKELRINAPSSNGTYNLYIMAIDSAGNISFKEVKGIKVDVEGPSITMYDTEGKETEGGSSTRINSFDYTIVVESNDSSLALDIEYKWVNNNLNESAFAGEYKCAASSSSDYSICKIDGSSIELGANIFDPDYKYSLIITAKDSAGNENTFKTNEFMIDTTPPVINIDINEDSWYTSGVINFTVNKENNTGTLDSVAYCLNDCKSEEDFDINKFSSLDVKDSTSESYSINVKLLEGENYFYVYASDILGNYAYVSKTIKHDSKTAEIVVTGIDEDSVVDLSNKTIKSLDFVIKDSDSGIKKYCLYYDELAVECVNGNGENEINKSVEVTKNGNYSIEVIDNSDNSVTYNFVVVGIDITPIYFDLITSAGDKFVSGSVEIIISNMRKDYLPDDVKIEDKVQSIDYVVLDYNATITSEEEAFSGESISVYNRSNDDAVVTKFIVSENKLYIVRIVDTAGNVSYNAIKVNNIDNDAPFINTDKDSITLKDRIYITTVSGNNLNVSVNDDGDKVYKYSNETIKIYFGSGSLMDKYTGFNNYLGLSVCFDAGDCVYETYSADSSSSDGYLANTKAIELTAPYNFSGFIRYYLNDGAGNVSEIYSFEIEHQNEVSGVSISLLDSSNNAVDANNKYNKVIISLSGDEIEEIVSNGDVRYVLARFNVNLYSEFENRSGSVETFLNSYKFIKISSSSVAASISDVDSTYYAWVYVRDLLNNYKLVKITTLINLDTISPTLTEIGLTTSKIDSVNYELSVMEFNEDYKLYIDLDNDGTYESATLTDNKYSFTVSGVNAVYVKVEDSAGNYTEELVDLNNTAPVIEYATKKNNSGSYSSYSKISYEVYVNTMAKLRFSDKDGLSHISLYKNEELVTSCYINDSSKDYNCIRSSGEIGLVVDGSYAYYYLDSSDYKVVAYDKLNNESSVKVYFDDTKPVINLYKKDNDSYKEQTTSKVYNTLKDLYVKVTDDNFSYLTIDLIDTVNGGSTQSTYFYTNEIGSCLSNSSVCEYGKALEDILTKNTSSYNKIVITAYDKANSFASISINYDDLVPQIWTKDVGESIVIGGMSYTIEENITINLEIGVNNKLTLDKILNALIVSVDGKSYAYIKDNDSFRKAVYLDEEVIDYDLLSYIGNYVIKLDYVDEAGNIAQTKEININVLDNTSPVLKLADTDKEIVEFSEDVTINGVTATDNYGLEKSSGGIIKEKNVALSEAVCSALVDGETIDCSASVIKVSSNVYKFTKVGVYTFTYTVSDLSLNSQSIVQVIEVRDTVGPIMTSAMNNYETSFSVYFSDRKNGDVSINSVSLNYPNSEDKGEAMEVTYAGLYSLNNMGSKYKVESDDYLVSDINKVVTYRFIKKGTYYLRFVSSDNVGNMSMFEYEVKALDQIAPSFSGVTNGQIIEMGLEEDISVDNIVSRYNITASDNYDSSIKIYHELRDSVEHSYEVVLKASDSSGNNSTLTLYIDCKDWVAPTVGELRLDDSTNKRELGFVIVGGGDNSDNWWHEYSVQGGDWIRYSSDSKLEFSGGVSQTMAVCVRAVDAAGLVSIDTPCKDILVDTKAPVVQGISDGSIVDTEVGITVSDDRLSNVEVWIDDELSSLTKDDVPYTFNKIGKYQIIAKDELGNTSIVSFIINTDTFMNIVNDINSSEYSVSSIEFDKRVLVPVDIKYDISGYSTITTSLNGVNINATDMAYILGVVPNTEATFVMFSVNGVNIGNYSNGITLISNGSSFKADVNNEDCFVKFNDSYYAYVIIKGNAYSDLVSDSEPENVNKGDGRFITFVLIGIGALVVILIGYQIVKFRKRVRAA